MNLLEILKDYENIGYKDIEYLYCTAFGKIKFINITFDDIDKYPIHCTSLDGECNYNFTKDGKLHLSGECIIFPIINNACCDWGDIITYATNEPVMYIGDKSNKWILGFYVRYNKNLNSHVVTYDIAENHLEHSCKVIPVRLFDFNDISNNYI